MPDNQLLSRLGREVLAEMENDILPYWLSLKDPQGGFFGEAGADGTLHPDAARGAILNARLVWTFSAAYNALGRDECLGAARWAYEYFTARFIDSEYGGVYWSVSADGAPLDTKKQLYSQGFAIYGLAEYYRASGDRNALDAACALFRCVEEHFADNANGGCIEALSREFSPLEDMSLSAHDINADKTMNSHLHLLEAYACLYSVWPDEALGLRVRELLDIVCHRIMHPCGHLQLYFDNAWNVLPGGWSYGHDIETSWLALECAQILGDDALTAEVSRCCRLLAAAGDEGLQDDGSMIYEFHPAAAPDAAGTDPSDTRATPDATVSQAAASNAPAAQDAAPDTPAASEGTADFFREWWVQAEAVVGNLWAWKYLSDSEGLERAARTWDYISSHLLDHDAGEWYWGINADGTPDLSRPKAGFWKCPYHNTRMCLQVAAIAAL